MKSSGSTIFDFNDEEPPVVAENSKLVIGMENSIAQLKEAIEKVKAKDQKADSSQSSKILMELESKAQKEVKRSKDDIYTEVVIDEVNDHLFREVNKAPGEVVVVMLR